MTKTTGILFVPEGYKNKKKKKTPVNDGALFGKATLSFIQRQIKNTKVPVGEDGSVTFGITTLNNLESRLEYFGFKGASDNVWVNATAKKYLVEKIMGIDTSKQDYQIIFGGRYDASDFDEDSIYLRYFDIANAIEDRVLFIPDEDISKNKDGELESATPSGYICVINNNANLNRNLRSFTNAEKGETFFTTTLGCVKYDKQSNHNIDWKRWNFPEAVDKERVYIKCSGIKLPDVSKIKCEDGKNRLFMIAGRYDFENDVHNATTYAEKQRANIEAGLKEEGKNSPESYIGSNINVKSASFETIKIIKG